MMRSILRGLRRGAITALGVAASCGLMLGSPAVAGATGFAATARQLAGAPLDLLARPTALVRIGSSLFILDGNAIERWNTATHTFATVAGNRAHAGSRDGLGATAWFAAPQGIATDGTDLYVADTGNDTVRKVTITTGAVSTIAGRAGDPGSVDGNAPGARFDHPWGIAVDADNVWIADRANFTVRSLAISTHMVQTRAGVAGQSAWRDGVGADARFSDPRALTTVSGAVWVTDGARIRRVQAATNAVTTLATIHDPGFQVTPTGVAAARGVVYAAIFVNDHDDTTGTEIVAVQTSNGAVDQVPAPDYRDATGLVVDPLGKQLTVVGSGAFYPALYRITLGTGTAHDLAPFNQTGFVDGAAANARFASPQGVVVSGTSVFVADAGNHAIRTVDTGTGVVTTLAHDVGLDLTALAFDNGSLYVADGSAVRRVDVASGVVERFATLPSAVNDLSVAGADLFVVANDCAVYRVPLATGVPSVFAGAAGTCGSADGIGAAARFGADATCPACPPLGIATDGSDLYVADHLSVRKVHLATAAVTTIVPAGPPYDPQLDISVAGGEVYVARILSIVRVAVTGGRVFRVTARGNLVDHLGSSPTRAVHTAVQPSGIAASTDGRRLYLTVPTGIGVIEDHPT